MKCVIALVLLICFAGCKREKVSSDIVFEKFETKRSIVLKENDSIMIRITVDSLSHLSSIIRYNSGVIDGEAVTFYPNGKVERKIDIRNGVHDGHEKYFYPSGALKRELFYCNGKPLYFGYEYWDKPVIITKYIVHFSDKGKVASFKIFDSSGNFLKDSSIMAHTTFPPG